MNAEPQDCSATVFLNLLRLSLGGASHDSDILLVRGDLSAAMPAAALQQLQRRGVRLQLRQAAIGLARRPQGWTLRLREGTQDFERVILAVPADSAARLLESAGIEAMAAPLGLLRALHYEPLGTVYLSFAQGVRLPHPLYALRDDASIGRYGQWVFDRGAIDPANGSILGVVVGGPALRSDPDPARLCEAVSRQVQEDFRLPAPQACRAVIERRATLLCRPGLRRPAARLPASGLYLAGDAADSPFPSTLEGSVRSGLDAARLAAADRAKRA